MTVPRIDQANWIPITAASILAVANIGTAALAAAVADPARKNITFHNPNYSSAAGVDLLLAQTATPTFAAPAGGIILLPGATVLIDGDAAAGPWFVTARSGSTNGLTVLPSMR